MLEPLGKENWSPEAAAHLLNRAGFGGTPQEISSLHAMGLDAAVDSLLLADDDSDLFPPPAASVPLDLEEVRRLAGTGTEQEKKRAQARLRQEEQQQMTELRLWWLNRMRWSPFPAREKLVLFWHGHWATSIEKVKSPFMMWQQNETLRADAFGGFEKMARDISRDPAMMRYLDLPQSKLGKPNENFARELMELFTLGEGNYSEQDIQQAARAFTGYRVNLKTQQFFPMPKQADQGTKSFFGLEGNFTGDDILAMLAADPQCARFLARKLWRFYASENPPDELTRALADRYAQSGLNTGALLAAMFRSREFYGPDVVRRQIKGPIQWLVQMCKQLAVPLPDQADGMLKQLGQVPFAPPNVKGWDGGRAWISSATLLLRYNTAGIILTKTKPDWKSLLPAKDPFGSLEWRLFQAPIPAGLSEKSSAFAAAHPSAYRDLTHLLMSTPDYQLT